MIMSGRAWRLLLAACWNSLCCLSISSLNPKPTGFFFQNMTEVLQQIGKGDYKVQVDIDPKRIGPYEPVASSINQMAEDLGRLERMRQEFISNVSHEIQSPLTSISGFSRELLDNDTLDDKERKEILEIIELESKRISKLSRNLLRLTSLESEQYPFEPKRYRLDRQLRAVVLACEPQWVEKKTEHGYRACQRHRLCRRRYAQSGLD